MSFYTGTQAELLYSLPAAVTKNTYTTQAPISAIASTSVPRCQIPAGFFASNPSAIGKTIHVEAHGTIANTSAATFIFAAGLDAAAGTIAGTGGATLFTSAALTPTASVTAPWTLEMDLVCQAAGNLGTTIQCNAEINVSSVASSGAWGTSRQTAMFANSLTGINSEIGFYLELFGTWSASASGNTTTLQQFSVYGCN
jgi:hypothetical protein